MQTNKITLTCPYKGFIRKENAKAANGSLTVSSRRLVFISHSSVDTWVAKCIAEKVCSCGARAFLDEKDIDIGEDFEKRIRESLNEAHELIALLTPWALKRPYIWVELGVAWGRGIPIIIVLHGITIKELQSMPNVPIFLKGTNIISINNLDRYFEELKSRVGHND